MENDFENDIWESLLKAAVIKNSLDEIEDYPFDEIKKIQIPEHYDTKMRRLVKRLHHQEMVKHALKYGKKIASVIFLIAGIGFTFLLQFDEVRAAYQNVITTIYEKFVRFDFSSSEEETVDLQLNYIPKGFTLTNVIANEHESILTYTNTNGENISISKFIDKRTIQIDNEHYIISDIQINHITGQQFLSTDKQFSNLILWNTDSAYYKLSSYLDIDTMKKIAENTK